MTFYKILVPLILLKNNENASYGKNIESGRFASSVQELVDGKYITKAKKSDLTKDQLAAVEQYEQEQLDAKDKASHDEAESLKAKEFAEAQRKAVADALEASKTPAVPEKDITVPAKEIEVTPPSDADKQTGPDPEALLKGKGK